MTRAGRVSMKSFVKLGCAIFALILLLRIAHNARVANLAVAGQFVSDWATLLGSAIAVLLAFGLWHSAKS